MEGKVFFSREKKFSPPRNTTTQKNGQPLEFQRLSVFV